MSWDDHSDELDDAVDARLGDCIQYADNGSNFTARTGFVIFETEDINMEMIDGSLGDRIRLKIAKDIVPVVEAHHRIKAAKKLGTQIYKPGPETPQEQGRYWIFDLMKAP